MAKSTLSVLSRIFEQFGESENCDFLFDLGIEVPTNEDDIISWISNAESRKDISARVFKFVLAKYRRQF